MEVSETFFLQDLKRQCGAYLANFIEVDNVADLLHTGRLFSIPRLEHQCVEFMARNIEEMVTEKRFKDLVLGDAKKVKSREETDTIDIVDEIRYVLRTTNLNSF